MATVEVFTKARMQAIEDEAIVDAELRAVGEQRQLILKKNNETEINVGDVRGPIGITPTLPPIPDELDWNATNWQNADVIAGSGAVGGAGVPTLKFQAGSVVITTNTVGRAAIYFPELFNGLASVIAQIGDSNGATYNHLGGIPLGGSTSVSSLGGLIVHLDVYATNGFHVNIFSPPTETTAFGGLANPVSIGGLTPVRINWMAFGW